MLLGGVRLVLQLYLPDSECHGSFQCLEGDFAGTQLNFALLLFYLRGTPFLAQIKYSSFRVVLLQLSCKDWSIPMQELPGHLTWCSFHFHCLVPYPGCVNWVPRRGWKWLLGWCPSQAGDTAELCWLRPHQLQPQARADFPNSQQGWARTAPHRITKSQNKRGWKRALRSSSPACDPTPPYQLNRGEALHLNPLRWDFPHPGKVALEVYLRQPEHCSGNQVPGNSPWETTDTSWVTLTCFSAVVPRDVFFPLLSHRSHSSLVPWRHWKFWFSHQTMKKVLPDQVWQLSAA